jgi:hypothetical protein
VSRRHSLRGAAVSSDVVWNEQLVVWSRRRGSTDACRRRRGRSQRLDEHVRSCSSGSEEPSEASGETFNYAGILPPVRTSGRHSQTGRSPYRRALGLRCSPCRRWWVRVPSSASRKGQSESERAFSVSELLVMIWQAWRWNRSETTRTMICQKRRPGSSFDATISRSIGLVQRVALGPRRIQGTLRLEQHLARTPAGLIARITARILALNTAIHLNWQLGQPSRHLSTYGH